MPAVPRVTRCYKIGEVAQRLGVTAKSLGDWIKKYGDNGLQHSTISSQQEELRRLKAELRRVTEERNILKEAAARSLQTSQGKVRIHRVPTYQIPRRRHVPSA